MKNIPAVLKKGASIKSGSLALWLLIVIAVLLITACQNQGQSGGENPSSETSTGTGGTPTEATNPNEITMEVFYHPYNTYLKDAAKLYEEKTGVKVIINNNYVEPELFEHEYVDKFGMSVDASFYLGFPDTSLYTERALTDLMTGSGADIYDVSSLDFESLGKNGLLVDMGDWMENDAEFSGDIVFRDILLSAKTENGVFAAPVDFTFTRLVAASTDEPLFEKRQILWQERMTWKEFFGKVEDIGYNQDLAYWGFDLEIFMERFMARASYFIDEGGNTQNLYSEEMISLLEECKVWRDTGLLGDFRDPVTLTAPFSYGRSYTIGAQSAYMLCTLPEEYKFVTGYPFYYFAPMPFDGDAVTTDEVDRYPAVSWMMPFYGVNAGSPNEEAAQEFLRFLLSEEGQDGMTNKAPARNNGFNFSINRAVFRGDIEKSLEFVQDYNKELEIELDFPVLINEAEETVDQIAYIITEKPYYRAIIREVAKLFFLDQISADEAARQMSDKVGLYLKEQG